MEELKKYEETISRLLESGKIDEADKFSREFIEVLALKLIEACKILERTIENVGELEKPHLIFLKQLAEAMANGMLKDPEMMVELLIVKLKKTGYE